MIRFLRFCIASSVTCAANSASSVAAEMMPPVGLLGETRTSSRERGVIEASMASGRSVFSRMTRISTVSGVAVEMGEETEGRGGEERGGERRGKKVRKVGNT